MAGIFTIRCAAPGFVSWLIAIAVWFAVRDRSWQIVMAQPLFNSLMVAVSSGLGAAAPLAALRRIRPTALSGVVLGGFRLAINIGGDLLALAPPSTRGVDR